MARWRRGTAEESATVPGQRTEPTLPPDAGTDDPARGGADQGSGAVLGGAQASAADDTMRDEASAPAAEQTRPDPPVPDGQPVPDEHQAVLTEAAPQAAGPQAATPADHKIRHTRLSGTWMAVVLFAVILVLLLIFILQNGHTVDVSYMGAHGHLALGVALLLAAVAGVLLTAIAGSARIMQLRATARKHRRADTRALKDEARAMEAKVKAARKAAKTRN